MSGICLDRLIAIMLYGRYNLIVTVPRVKFFTIFCWVTFSSINIIYIIMHACCLITPLSQNQYYTFGYGEFEDSGNFYSVNNYLCMHALIIHHCSLNCNFELKIVSG